MISVYGGKSILRVATALTLIAFVPACLAWPGKSSSGSSPNTDKHARKIHHEISHFKTGNYVHMVFRDGSERTGALESFDDTAFTVTNAENNVRETHAYTDIHSVKREKDYIGEGSEEHVRHVPVWVPITVGVLVAGGAATAALVR